MSRWSYEGKEDQLQGLYEKWGECEKCELHLTRRNVVFGEGNADADIVVVGEGPGEDEDREGSPFIGASGILLNDLLTVVGIDREDLFITNLVMCRPPGNRDPNKAERVACSTRLYEQIYAIDPLLIIPVGKPAMAALMGGEFKSIVEKQGTVGPIVIPGRYGPVVYSGMPILHPAYILRKDRVSPATGTWKEGGPAHRTLVTLGTAKDMVRLIRRNHKRVVDGSPSLKVIQ